MNPFYSIAYVPLKQEAHERLSIGLFMRDKRKLFFVYSKFKMGLVKELVSRPAYDLLNLALKNLVKSVKKANEINAQAQLVFASDYSPKGENLKEGYFSYLSRYSNNLLAFTKPSSIDVAVNETNFKLLFGKFIDEKYYTADAKEDKIDIVQQTKSRLKPIIKNQVNWDFSITRKHLPKLILPSVQIDFAGKNGMFVSGQTIDFTKKTYFLENDISKQIVLLDAMKQANEQSTSFVLGQEPNKNTHPKNHRIWKNIVDESRIEFVDASELNRISEYIQSNDVKPLDMEL